VNASQAVLLLSVLLVAVSMGYVAFHFFDQFSRRRHPGSVVGASLPLGYVVAALLVLEPGMAHHRPLVLALSVVVSTFCAVQTYFNRRRDRRERRR